MKRGQLISLAGCTLGLYTIGVMALTLLPVYAVQLGMDESAIGLFLSLAFTSLSVGSLSSGWLSSRFQRRKRTIIVIGILAAPATFMIGQVSNLVVLTAFTLIVWFAAGVATGTVNILAGLHSDPHERGRVFGTLASSVALGIALGGFAASASVERWGFSGLYTVGALIWLIPIITAIFIQDKVQTRSVVTSTQSVSAPLPRALWMLLVASVLVSVTNFSGGLAMPLKMNELAFDASAIATTSGVSGLVALPVPFLIGWLSDRVGRKHLLIAGYLMTNLGILLLIPASHLWQFWLSASLRTLAGGAAGVANALITDLTPSEALSTALSRFAATAWVGGIFGYAATGIIVQTLGLSSSLLLVASLPLCAMLLILFIRHSSVQVAPA